MRGWLHASLVGKHAAALGLGVEEAEALADHPGGRSEARPRDHGARCSELRAEAVTPVQKGARHCVEEWRQKNAAEPKDSVLAQS